MKVQISLVAVLLGLVLLVGHSHAQTEEDDNCIADMVSTVAGNVRQNRGMLPFMKRVMERVKGRNGTKLGEKMEYLMSMCSCIDESAETTDAQVCQCAEEIKECGVLKPNSTTAPEEIKAKYNSWMDCLGEARLARVVACKEELFSTPGQMICKIKKIQCSQTE